MAKKITKKTPSAPLTAPEQDISDIVTPDETATAADASSLAIKFGVLAVILLFTAFLYWPSLDNGFTNYDDNVYVTENSHLVWNSANLDTLLTKQVAGNFHPLTMWSLAWDRGSDASTPPAPRPFHQTSLVLHLLNTILVFWLALRLRFGTWVAAIAALFFAIHPLHVESVAWVSSRKDVLYSFFFLGGLIAATHARSKNTINWGYLALVFVLFVLSLLSKPAAIIFPLVLWLLHWYEDRSGAVQGKNLLYLIPFLICSAISTVITFAYQKDIGAVDEQFTVVQRFLFACYGAVVYLVKLVLPFNLSAFHPAPYANANLGINFYLAPLGAGALLAVGVWAYQKHRNLFFAIAFYLINLVLVLGFVKLGSSLYAERYTYMAYTGWLMLAGLGLVQLWKKGGIMRVPAAALLLGFTAMFAVQTRNQIGVWKNSETLWNQVIKLYPTEKNYSARGYDYYTTRQWDKALRDFDRCYALNPNVESTLTIRGICLQKLNRPDEALKVYTECQAKFPNSIPAAFELGNILFSKQQYQEAIAQYNTAVRLSPNHIDALNNRGNAWFMLKDYPKAIADFSSVLFLNPNFISGLNNRGSARLALGDRAAAAKDFKKSLELNPNQPNIVDYLNKAEK